VPPDDDLFPVDEGSPSPPPKGGNGSAHAEGSPGGDGPLTRADMLSLVREFVDPNTEQMNRITQNQQRLSSALDEVQSALQRLGVTGSRGGEESPEEWSPTSLLTNPEALPKAVRNEVMAVFKEQIAPILTQGIEARHTQTVSELRREIDGTYGVGTWDKEFAPELNPLFDKVRKESPSRLGDVEAIRKSVQVVKGEKFDKLVEAKAQADKARQAEEEEWRKDGLEFVKSNLSGGIGLRRDNTTLTPEAKDFLDRIWKAKGERPDEQEFLTALNCGSTITDWEAATKKTGAK
jgi:hypothetical protein